MIYILLKSMQSDGPLNYKIDNEQSIEKMREMYEIVEKISRERFPNSNYFTYFEWKGLKLQCIPPAEWEGIDPTLKISNNKHVIIIFPATCACIIFPNNSNFVNDQEYSDMELSMHNILKIAADLKNWHEAHKVQNKERPNELQKHIEENEQNKEVLNNFQIKDVVQNSISQQLEHEANKNKKNNDRPFQENIKENVVQNSISQQLEHKEENEQNKEGKNELQENIKENAGQNNWLNDGNIQALHQIYTIVSHEKINYGLTLLWQGIVFDTNPIKLMIKNNKFSYQINIATNELSNNEILNQQDVAYRSRSKDTVKYENTDFNQIDWDEILLGLQQNPPENTNALNPYNNALNHSEHTNALNPYNNALKVCAVVLVLCLFIALSYILFRKQYNKSKLQ